MDYKACSAPTSLARCVIKVERPKRRIIETFRQLQGGKAFIEMLARGRKLYWEGRNVVSFGDVTVTSDQLEDILESEGDVELPEPYPTVIAHFLGERVVKREKVEGLVTVAEIADELGKDVRKVRAYLRDKIEKPEQGWAWPEDELMAIKKMIAKMR